jgi:LacI family transcriptional regulator
MKKITIQHIAERAGVSKGTVSRVFNAHPAVAGPTRRAVLEAMEELGYVPDLAARELSMRSEHTLGVTIDQADRRLSPYFVLFMQALSKRLQQAGISLVDLDGSLEGYRQLPSAVLVFGVRESDPRLEVLGSREVPAILIGHQAEHAWVAPADWEGAHQATAHLIALGHRRIAHLSGFTQNQAFQDRYLGYYAALEEAGIAPKRHFVLDGAFNTIGGYRAVRRAWEQGLRFTGLFAASDEMAIGAIAALEDLGVKVPWDVSVVGFDGLPSLPCALTTVEQDIPRIAATALELALERIGGQPPRGVVVPVRLRVRETSARCLGPLEEEP